VKKTLLVILLLFLTLALFAGCSENDRAENPGQGGIDVDLTAFSASMIYATVIDILSNPEDYTGKTIKAAGIYEPIYFEGIGRFRHSIIVEAPGCCPHPIEFKLSGGAQLGDYPSAGASIKIEGVFGIGEEAGFILPYLTVDDVLVIE
jgi:hypothetical protein